jgi:hypothetical protein
MSKRNNYIKWSDVYTEFQGNEYSFISMHILVYIYMKSYIIWDITPYIPLKIN